MQPFAAFEIILINVLDHQCFTLAFENDFTGESSQKKSCNFQNQINLTPPMFLLRK